MKNITVPSELHAFMQSYSKFFIIGHSEPDGDCIGSQITISRYLRRLGKETELFSPGPFRRPEILEFEPLFRNRIPAGEIVQGAAAIIVDCSTLERIGTLAGDIEGLPVAVIDHHSSGNQFGTVRFIEPEAPSVTFLIQKIMESSGMEPDKEEARLLLFGLCTDTGFFRHLQDNTSDVFQSIARLVDHGTSTREIHSMIFGNRSFESRKLLGLLLSRIESHFGGRLILTWETLEETDSYGIRNRDSDSLYQLLQAVAGCEVVVLIREEYPENTSDATVCSVGLRSKKDMFDVGKVARDLGGGGHRQAAGFTTQATVQELRQSLLSVFSPMFPGF